ncbi:MAG: sulfur carrier protein ThiS [Peptococcaceae bacterium]
MKINGTETTLAEGTTLLTYLQQQGYKLDRIAVEYNGTIVTREQYVSVVLEPTDVLEIVSFVGGG